MLLSNRRKISGKTRSTIFSDDVLDSKKDLLSMMKLIIMCIRGNRSIKHEREKHNVGELASYSEAQREKYNVEELAS